MQICISEAKKMLWKIPRAIANTISTHFWIRIPSAARTKNSFIDLICLAKLKILLTLICTIFVMEIDRRLNKIDDVPVALVLFSKLLPARPTNTDNGSFDDNIDFYSRVFFTRQQ